MTRYSPDHPRAQRCRTAGESIWVHSGVWLHLPSIFITSSSYNSPHLATHKCTSIHTHTHTYPLKQFPHHKNIALNQIQWINIHDTLICMAKMYSWILQYDLVVRSVNRWLKILHHDYRKESNFKIISNYMLKRRDISGSDQFWKNITILHKIFLPLVSHIILNSTIRYLLHWFKVLISSC